MAEFTVPAHKLTEKGLRALLKAIVASERGRRPETIALFYVNKRRGEPSRLPLAEICVREDLERNQLKYFCGTWECYALATQQIDPSIVALLRKELGRTKGN